MQAVPCILNDDMTAQIAFQRHHCLQVRHLLLQLAIAAVHVIPRRENSDRNLRKQGVRRVSLCDRQTPPPVLRLRTPVHQQCHRWHECFVLLTHHKTIQLLDGRIHQQNTGCLIRIRAGIGLGIDRTKGMSNQHKRAIEIKMIQQVIQLLNNHSRPPRRAQNGRAAITSALIDKDACLRRNPPNCGHPFLHRRGQSIEHNHRRLALPHNGESLLGLRVQKCLCPRPSSRQKQSKQGQSQPKVSQQWTA